MRKPTVIETSKEAQARLEKVYKVLSKRVTSGITPEKYGFRVKIKKLTGRREEVAGFAEVRKKHPDLIRLVRSRPGKMSSQVLYVDSEEEAAVILIVWAKNYRSRA